MHHQLAEDPEDACLVQAQSELDRLLDLIRVTLPSISGGGIRDSGEGRNGQPQERGNVVYSKTPDWGVNVKRCGVKSR